MLWLVLSQLHLFKHVYPLSAQRLVSCPGDWKQHAEQSGFHANLIKTKPKPWTLAGVQTQVSFAGNTNLKTGWQKVK